MNIHKLLLESVQVIENRPILNNDMRFAAFVVAATIVAEDRTCVYTTIDSQQRHPYPLKIVIRQRPEAAVGIAVLGANSWMHHERSAGGNSKDLFFQNEFAAGDRQVGLNAAKKFAGLGSIW